MKARGIVRRIDDLGRVVIPKEIRRTLRIREGDPLEISTDREGEVILKKYSPICELGEFATKYAESLHEASGHTAIITDRDVVVSVTGNGKKEYADKKVSKELDRIMEGRVTAFVKKGDKEQPIVDNEKEDLLYITQVIAPIVTHGDPIGSVILCSREKEVTMGEVEEKLAQTAAVFLAKQME